MKSVENVYQRNAFSCNIRLKSPMEYLIKSYTRKGETRPLACFGELFLFLFKKNIECKMKQFTTFILV